MLHTNSNVFDQSIEEKIYKRLLQKDSKFINENELESILYSIKMLWLQRTDKLPSDFNDLIWVHERFAFYQKMSKNTHSNYAVISVG